MLQILIASDPLALAGHVGSGAVEHLKLEQKQPRTPRAGVAATPRDYETPVAKIVNATGPFSIVRVTSFSPV